MSAPVDILTNVDDAEWIRIAEKLFGNTLGSDIGRPSFQAYVAFFKSETSLLHQRIVEEGLEDVDHPLKDLAIETTEDLRSVVDLVRRSPGSSRNTILKSIQLNVPRNSSPGGLGRSLDLTLRLWLMLDIRAADLRTFSRNGTSTEWRNGRLSQNLITKLFPQAAWTPTHREGRLHAHFTAANMEKFCGLDVRPTSNLADHLLLDHTSIGVKHRKTVLWVFHHRRVLEAHMADFGSPYPKALLVETLNTLTLLFPPWDHKTRSRYGDAHHVFDSTTTVAQHRLRYLSAYPYWRDRLSDVYDEVFSSPPVSVSQLWYDRRNPQLWWTFWTAFAIAVVTVLSFVTGLVSMVASIDQTYVSKVQDVYIMGTKGK